MTCGLKSSTRCSNFTRAFVLPLTLTRSVVVASAFIALVNVAVLHPVATTIAVVVRRARIRLIVVRSTATVVATTSVPSVARSSPVAPWMRVASPSLLAIVLVIKSLSLSLASVVELIL